MHQLTARVCINTPLFLAGANQATAELRPASIKGQLRFWWRALQYARYDGDITQLAQAESSLFGSTAGQAAFRLTVANVKQSKAVTPPSVHEELASRAGARYLGYGLVEAFPSSTKGTKAGQLTERACIDTCSFELKITSRQPIAKGLVEAIRTWGLLGGLGSRSRKGFGSVTVTEMELKNAGSANSFSPVSDPSSLNHEIQSLVGASKGHLALPTISAFSSHTRVDLLMSGQGGIDLLNEYGLRMMQYRSWGQSSKQNMVNGRKSEMRFKDDHDWSKGTLNEPSFHPRRVVFGMPHNYGKGDRNTVKPQTFDRRASPLFFHIHRFSEKSFAGIALILASEFLPKGELISAGGRPVATHPEYSVLTGFLDATEKDDDGVDTKQPYFDSIKNIQQPQVMQ